MNRCPERPRPRLEEPRCAATRHAEPAASMARRRHSASISSYGFRPSSRATTERRSLCRERWPLSGDVEIRRPGDFERILAGAVSSGTVRAVRNLLVKSPNPPSEAGLGSNQAAGVGFEPTRHLSAPNGFQDRPFRPLRHPADRKASGVRRS